MVDYKSPEAELIEFDVNIHTEEYDLISGCSCHFDGNNAATYVGAACTGSSGHAAENPYGVLAPNWN